MAAVVVISRDKGLEVFIVKECSIKKEDIAELLNSLG
jgi:hypothetical protein